MSCVPGTDRGGAHVVIVAPVHDYRDIRVFQKEAKSLAAAGYRVSLLARAPAALEEDGVHVVPLPSPPHRLLRFASLPGVLLRALKLRGDAYHLHNPDTLPLALALRLLGRRVVYDTHEDFSRRLLQRRWIPRPLRRPLSAIVAAAERFVARAVDLPIATQPAVRDRMGPGTLLLGNPPIVGGPLIARARALAATLQRDPDVFRLVYPGRITRPRGLYTTLDALELANRRIRCRLWLIGPFDEGDLPEAGRHPGWVHVDYLGVLPQHEAFAHIARADAGLITLLDVGDFRDTSPNKLFEYLTFGVPFIASDFPLWRSVLDGAAPGLFVPPGDAAAVAKAIELLAADPELRREMGRAGRDFVSGFNWDRESERLLSAYAALLTPRASHDVRTSGT